MKKLLLMAMITGMSFSLTGCETTGDPTQGGIFWSPSKAQNRLDQRQQTLNQINADTSRVQRSNQDMQDQVDQNR